MALANLSFFLFRRLAFRGHLSFSRTIVRIAVAAVAFGIAIMLIAMAIVDGFQVAIPAKITGFWGDVQLSSVEPNEGIEARPFAFTPENAARLRTLAGVQTVAPFAIKAGVAKTDSDFEGVMLKGVARSYPLTYIAQHLTAGHLPQLSDTGASSECLIPQTLADKLQIGVGSRLFLYFIQRPPRVRRFTICGIYKTGVEVEFGRPYLICDLRQVQTLNNWDSTLVSGAEATLAPYADGYAVANEMRKALPPDITATAAQDSYPQVFAWLGLFDTNETVVIVLMLAVAGINVVSALLILILERTQMIGLLKALGQSDAHIRNIFLWNAAYVVAVGLLLGNTFGLGFCWLEATHPFIPLDEESYYVPAVPIVVHWGKVLAVNVGTLIACLVAVLAPIAAAKRVSPVKALRFE